MTREQKIYAMLDACRSLEADIRYDPEYGHLIVLAWESRGERYARYVQGEIQRRAAQYPGLVCYCFDLFSTLIYAV